MKKVIKIAEARVIAKNNPIADRFGVNGIKSTFTRAFREWKDNYKYLTELSMVLNHKIGYFYDQNKPMDARCNRIAALYSALWEQVND